MPKRRRTRSFSERGVEKNVKNKQRNKQSRKTIQESLNCIQCSPSGTNTPIVAIFPIRIPFSCLFFV